MQQEKVLSYLQKIREEGDAGAYKLLYQIYFKRLFKFAFLIVRSKEEAEEVVNDVFIRIWEKREKLEVVKHPHAYFYTLTKNRAIDYLRKKKTGEKIDIDSIRADLLAFKSNPHTILQTKELKTKIEEAVNSLPPRCKLIFKLIREDGLKYKEAARVLDLSLKTVEAQMRIALKKLAAIFKEQNIIEEEKV